MIGATMAWMATALLVCVPLAFYITRMRKAPPTYDRNAISLLWKWIIASVLIIIGIVGLWSPSSPEWVRALSPICIFFCLLFSYLANHQLFYGIARPVLTNKLFLTTTLFSCIVLLLDWLRGTNRGVFLTNEPFEPTFVYYAY